MTDAASEPEDPTKVSEATPAQLMEGIPDADPE